MDHNTIFAYFKNRELNELYLSIAIRSFGISLVGIFIPIYLIHIGYSLKTVALFYMIIGLTHAAFSIPSAKIAARYGFKHLILFSAFISILATYLLSQLPKEIIPIPLLAILAGLGSSLYWVGYHVDFCSFSLKKLRGSQVGVMQILSALAFAIGPSIGGLIILHLGFSKVLLLYSIILLISTIPLFFSKDIHEKSTFRLKGLFSGRRLKDYLAFIGHGIECSAAKIVWPLYLYLFILLGTDKLGYITTLTFLMAILFTFFISKYIDSKRVQVLKGGVILNFVVWIFRVFIKTPFQAIFTEAAYGLTSTAKNISYNAISYDKANKTEMVQYLVLREVIGNLGKAAFFAILFFYSSYVFAILSGAGSSLFYFLF